MVFIFEDHFILGVAKIGARSAYQLDGAVRSNGLNLIFFEDGFFGIDQTNYNPIITR
jgi:hypothetical protein